MSDSGELRLLCLSAHPDDDADSGKRQTWRLQLESHPETAPRDSDIAAAARNAIAVVPYDPTDL